MIRPKIRHRSGARRPRRDLIAEALETLDGAAECCPPVALVEVTKRALRAVGQCEQLKARGIPTPATRTKAPPLRLENKRLQSGQHLQVHLAESLGIAHDLDGDDLATGNAELEGGEWPA